MYMRQPRVLIVGAGIAGLALAHALHGQGITADVVERAERPSVAAGTGMFLPENAVRALKELGVGEELTKLANPIHRQRLLDQSGELLSDIDMIDVWGEGATCLAIHRADLYDILLDAASAVPIRFGLSLVGLSDGKVTFDDGSEQLYDLVVGADGLHSTLRQIAFPDAEITPFGQVSWRFVAEGFPALTEWTVRLAGDRSFLTVALGEGRVYCYADTLSRDLNAPDGDWRELFTDFADPVPKLLEQGAAAYFSPIAGVLDLLAPAETRPPVLMIGDAAHASSPNMAQGAAMAVEDALVLAEILGRQPIEMVPTVFQVRRQPRLRWVHEQARRRDSTRRLPSWVRHPVLRFAGARLFRANNALLRQRP
jgi:2-polyprenyl-6-methoxyphenol hydroxylase-like FAD-dependent oxidoreductase